MKRTSQDNIEFGKTLSALRKKKNLTAHEVATAIGVATSTYRDWESGRAITGNPYKKMTEIYEVSLAQLFGIQEEDKTKQLEKIEELEKLLRELKLALIT